MWSRAGGLQPPPFIRTLLKAMLIWPISLLRRKRIVTIYAENITSRVKEWSKLSRLEFDGMLEKWYDADLEMMGLTAETET